MHEYCVTASVAIVFWEIQRDLTYVIIRYARLFGRHIVFMLVCHFHSRFAPNDSNEICIVSPTGLTATPNTHVESGNNYAVKLLFSQCLRIAVCAALNTCMDN